MDKEPISIEAVASKILVIRGKKVMLDRDLAQLYQVQTGQLTRQVRRNRDRFPEDFMLQLTTEELKNLMCQIGISSWGGIRKLPLAFTEQGVAMLSGVLRSKRAIMVNIAIMRVFVKLREFLLTHKELSDKIDALERKYAEHDSKLVLVFEAIRQLLKPPDGKEKQAIGFK